MTCPACSITLSPQDAATSMSAGTFRCPSGGRELTISRRYFRFLKWLSVACTSIGVWLVGYRGLNLVFVTLFAWIPTWLVVQLFAARFLRTPLDLATNLEGPLDHFSIHDPPKE